MGSPLRILHVVVNMNRGGAETLIMSLFRNIDRTNIQFDFLTCKPGIFDEEIVQLGGRVHRIPYITDVGHLNYMRRLHQFFTKYPDYRIIHAHLDKMSGFILRAAKRAGIPVRISHSHSTSSEGSLPSKIYKNYAGTLIGQNATHFMACSEKAANWLFPGKGSVILKNGIDPKQFAFSHKRRKEVRERLGIKENSFVLGHVGRFSPVKNHSFIIDIFAKFQKSHKESMLVLIGDGELRPTIEKKIKELKIEEKVILTGVRHDIDRYLQAFDLFIFPSMYEGLPVSLIEAQGSGLPCFISDHIAEEVDLGLGLIHYCPLHEPRKWLEKITKITGRKNKREIPPEAILKKGYDIQTIANFISDYYASFEVKINEKADDIYTYL